MTIIFDKEMKKGNYAIMGLLCVFLIYSCQGSEKLVKNERGSYLQNKYAKILDVNNLDLNNVKLYSFIDQWYGTNYKYGGFSKKGIDCSGFCKILYSEVYDKEIERTTQSLANQIKQVEKENLQEGDLVFFNISKKKNSHVGVYLVNKQFVHASTSSGVIISSLENIYYKQSFSKGGNLQ